MKGGFSGVRGKQISLTLIALICMTILIWAWEENPLLATFLPPQSQLSKSSPEILMGTPVISLTSSKPDIHVEEDLSNAVPGGETIIEQKEEKIDVVAPFASTIESIPEKSKNNRDKRASPVKQKEILLGYPEEGKKPQEDLGGETRPEPAEQSVDRLAPTDSATTTSYKKEKDDNSTMVLAEKKACNYGKGKWVEDSRRPLYSGLGCKQWLSQMWACRLTQRTDFSYEQFRWQPDNCEMAEFEGSSFLRRMQDKTIALVGDSLGRQQFQSLMCMVTGGKERPDVQDVGREYGLVKAHGAIRPDGWAYRFPSTNTTILYYWSASLCDLEPLNSTNRDTDWAMHLDRPPAFLRRFLHRFDVLVLNTGHHWNRGKFRANRWVMHVGGVPNTNKKIAEIGGAKNFATHSIVKWLDSKLPEHPRLKAFFRTISPRHFFHGDWNSGGSCDNTTPLAGGKEVLQDESSDPLVSEAVKGTRVKILDITALSQLRDEGHISRYSIKSTPGVQDCLHWCLPGIPDTWNEVLFGQI